ncbi:MAG: DUF6285 domain-containing protein [Pirellulales bacterium]
MNDRPTAEELIAAARHFLQEELLPALADRRLRFQTLVAANVLSIVERELRSEAAHLRQEWEWLAPLLERPKAAPAEIADLREAVLDANRELCERIRHGAFDEPTCFDTVAKGVRRTVERKLEIANPKYLAEFRREEH